eukprot:7725785-Ditylum_brightwellii.AAC.1
MDMAQGGRKPATAMSQGKLPVHFGACDTTDPTKPDSKQFIAPAFTRRHRGTNSAVYICGLTHWNTTDQK